MGRSRKIVQHVPIRTAWPILTPIEPMSGDFGILSRSKDPELSPFEDQFITLYEQSLTQGIFDTYTWEKWCSSTNIPFTPLHEHSAALPIVQTIPLNLMSDLCEDYIPHIGSFINDLLWAGSDSSNLRILGGAIASTLPLLKHGHCALYRASEQHPKLIDTLHRSLTPHHRTPTMLWKKTGNTATPLLPLARQYHPVTIVNLSSIPTDIFISKVLLIGQSSWKAHLILPIHPDLEKGIQSQIYSRILLAWFRYKRHNSKIFLEDILRERSDIIYRTYMELLD